MKKFLAVFILIPILTFAQSEQKTDSLQKVITSKLADSIKVKAYGRLITIYLDSAPEKAVAKTQELLDRNKKGTCPDCEALAVYYKAQIASRKGDFDTALKLFDQSAKFAWKHKLYDRSQFSAAWKIQTLLNQQQNEKAKAALDALLKQSKTIKDNPNLHQVYFLYGILNYQMGHLKTAIENYQIADSIIGTYKEPMNMTRSGVVNNIAQIYRELKNYDKSRTYANSALDMARKAQDSTSIMNMILHQGIIETEAKQYVKALPLLDRSYLYFKKIDFSYYKGSAALYLGIAYYGLKQYKNSLFFLSDAKLTYEQSQDFQSLAETMGYMARNYVATRNFAEARKCIDRSKLLMKDATDSPAFIEIIGAEVDYYEATGDYKNALTITRYQRKLQEALQKKMNESSLNELEARYQTGKKDKRIQTLSDENELTEKQKMAQLYIFVSIVFLLIVAGFMIYSAYKNRIRTAEKLREINDMKSKFFANISHEFRTPLTLIKSPLQTLETSKIDEDQRKQLALIDKHSDRMLELVNQLLELSKIDSGHFKLILKEGKLDDFLHSIIEPFAFQAKENGISFISNIEKTSGMHHFDKDVIEKIATNLLSNAFKYSTQKQPVYFSGTIEKKEIHLRISNSGTDLKKEDLPKLFERFYQKNESQNSSGIGLALVKELVELYNGSIETALDGQTLRFLIRLPLDKNNPNALKTVMDSGDTRTARSQTTEPTAIIPQIENKELPILLVVDDNAEIRQVISGIFASEYKILEAPNGEKALKMAQKEIPDCIISDIMMPKMDGLAFTHALKNNELTSFIPLILLTAKTSQETHLEALKSTADAFLTKPFNHEILKATVAQLIAERRKLQERYSQELVLKPVDIVINSVDEKFLDKLQKVLQKELPNSSFSADDFAKEIGMSRMQLHRKLKTLIGVSSTEFLRNERLKTAADLLQKGNANVSEVAYTVGFNDLSYFSKCFKERYQMTPTEYMERN